MGSLLRQLPLLPWIIDSVNVNSTWPNRQERNLNFWCTILKVCATKRQRHTRREGRQRWRETKKDLLEPLLHGVISNATFLQFSSITKTHHLYINNVLFTERPPCQLNLCILWVSPNTKQNRPTASTYTSIFYFFYHRYSLALTVHVTNSFGSRGTKQRVFLSPCRLLTIRVREPPNPGVAGFNLSIHDNPNIS